MGGKFSELILAVLNDPSRKEKCEYCEGIGWLKTKSNKRVVCIECDGDGEVLNVEDLCKPTGAILSGAATRGSKSSE